MKPGLVRFIFPRTSRGLQFFKYYCIIYCLIELAFIGASASSALFLQFDLCLTSISAEAATVLSICWTFYKKTLKSIKTCIILSGLSLLITIIAFPIINDYYTASLAMCSDIISYSTNATAVDSCSKLMISRTILKIILTIEVPLKIFWVLTCILGYFFKVAFLKLIDQLKLERQLQREKELAELREKERRRKERRRKELKDKTLNRE